MNTLKFDITYYEHVYTNEKKCIIFIFNNIINITI